MSKFNKTNTESVQARAIDDIATLIASGGSSVVSKEVAGFAINLEGLDDTDFNAANDSFQTITNDLRGTTLGQEILAAVPASQVDLALEAAALTIMAAGDPVASHLAGGVAPAEGGAVMLNTAAGNNDYSLDFNLESFEEASLQKYIAHSAYANAMAVISGGFEEVFYPAHIVPAGTTGYDVSVSIPKVFPSLKRSNDGTPVEFKKRSIIEALSDSSILDVESTVVVPYASDATSPAALVPAAVVPTSVRQIDGKDINTRPILFNTAVDLIALSSAPALLTSGIFDETDSLDTVINIGRVFFEAVLTTDAAGTPVETKVMLSADITAQIGSLLTVTAEGSSRDYQANLTARLNINQNLVAVTGDKAAFVTAIETVMGVAPGTKWDISTNMLLSATANVETAVMEVFANRTELSNVYDANGAPLGTSMFATANEILQINAIGYIPNVNRTNSNLRTRGTIIDSTSATNYRFPIPMGAPFISQNAIGQKVNTSIEALGHVQRIRNNNNAVKALMNLESVLRADNGLPVNSTYIGSELVTPTLVEESVDVNSLVVSLGSKDAIENLRGHLVAVLTNTANRMIQDSGYLAALEFVEGNNVDFEVILVTDTHIANHIMSSGDGRTLGDGRNFVITQSLNSAFKGKIYMGLRRKNRSGLSPLDHGGHLINPALIHDVQIQRSGATVKELHLVPRSVFVGTLPVLGLVNVSGLDSIWVDA